MEALKQLYTVDDVWEMITDPACIGAGYELINGELREMAPTNALHSWVAGRIYHHLLRFAMELQLGEVFIELGQHPADDRSTLLVADVAFCARDRFPDGIPETFLPFMPDLAVEVWSPSNRTSEMRRKTDIYLREGTKLVWLVWPRNREVEVCRLHADGKIESHAMGLGETLSGESVLPGFELPIAKIFPAKKR